MTLKESLHHFHGSVLGKDTLLLFACLIIQGLRVSYKYEKASSAFSRQQTPKPMSPSPLLALLADLLTKSGNSPLATITAHFPVIYRVLRSLGFLERLFKISDLLAITFQCNNFSKTRL